MEAGRAWEMSGRQKGGRSEQGLRQAGSFEAEGQ